jgi:hypothetical protein
VTVVEADRSPSPVETRLGGRFRLDERISVGDHISGTCGATWEAGGLSLWKATDELLSRPVTIYLLPAGGPVAPDLVAAILDAITNQALRGQAPDAPARPLTPAALAMALRGVRRPSHAARPWAEPGQALPRESVSRRRARHARARGGLLHHTTLLRSAV